MGDMEHSVEEGDNQQLGLWKELLDGQVWAEKSYKPLTPGQGQQRVMISKYESQRNIKVISQ